MNRIRLSISPKADGTLDRKVVAIDGKLRTEIDISACVGRFMLGSEDDEVRLQLEVLGPQVDIELPQDLLSALDAPRGVSFADHEAAIVEVRKQLEAVVADANDKILKQSKASWGVIADNEILRAKITELEAKFAAAQPETPTGTTTSGAGKPKR